MAAWLSGGRSLSLVAVRLAGTGDVAETSIMVSSQRHNTLIHFRYNPEHKGQRGEHGMGSNCTGLDGKSVVLQVPVGTSVYDQETGELIHDFSEPDERLVIAKGGRGGRGNQHFATSTHQAPREHELGRARRGAQLTGWNSSLLADVGLVGYPNAGKSTLISRISAAKPKIADYPFTTLEPNLGVVTVGEEPNQESFVVADMPGLLRARTWAPVSAFSSCAISSELGCWFTWLMFRTPRGGRIRSKTSRSSIRNWPALSPSAADETSDQHPLARQADDRGCDEDRRSEPREAEEADRRM